MVGVRLNAITGEILWYTLDFFPLSRQPQRGVCRHAGRLIQCPAEAAPPAFVLSQDQTLYK